ncbi:MAG: efflux RND transporter permease subunit, partial [Sporomusa sp.]
MARFFIERPVFARVLSLFITIGGIIAGFNLPIAQYPQISPPQVSVSATYTGANAKVVEETVAQVIEKEVNGVEDMVYMSSTSSDSGRYSLNVRFKHGVDPDMATVRVQNKVAQANATLPQDVLNNGVTTKKVSPDMALMFALSSPKGTYDATFLKNYGSIYFIEDVKRVKGVGDISEYGSDFAMRIWLKPDKMAQLGVTAADISTAIESQNIQAPAGGIGKSPAPTGQEFEYTVQVQGRLIQQEEFENIIVRSLSDGSSIKVKDVATVELESRSFSFHADMNRAESAGFAVNLTPDANALDTVAGVRQVLDEAAKNLPDDVELLYIYDSTENIRASLTEVVHTFFEALLLVLVVVFLFLQSARATFIPMLAIPVSLVGTFAAFVALDFSINTLTLFAMVLAIGLVVDDAIVVIEAVEYNMRDKGLGPKEATIAAMDQVSGPVIAIAFVLASVFIPVAFMGGTTGILYRQFALTIAISMALSAVVALSLTPALCTLMLKPHDPNAHKGLTGRFFDAFNNWFERTVQSYGLGLGKVTKRVRLVMVLLIVLVIMIGGIAKYLPTAFVPEEDQGFFAGSITLPEATNLE